MYRINKIKPAAMATKCGGTLIDIHWPNGSNVGGVLHYISPKETRVGDVKVRIMATRNELLNLLSFLFTQEWENVEPTRSLSAGRPVSVPWAWEQDKVFDWRMKPRPRARSFRRQFLGFLSLRQEVLSLASGLCGRNAEVMSVCAFPGIRGESEPTWGVTW